MQITRQADYAVRAVLHLSLQGQGGHSTTGQIAAAQQIPVHFLAKIVAQLSQAGILRTTRGARGGVALGRPAHDISMLQVVEAIDGPMAVNECVIHPESCPQVYSCLVRPSWQEAQSVLVESLSRTRFDQFSQQPALAVETTA
jgi:Rrf2 family protein